MRRFASVLRRLTVASFGGLCLSVLAVAVVAMVAEAHQTWEWYFRMEQTMSLLTPVTLALLGLTVVCAFGLVYVAPEG